MSEIVKKEIPSTYGEFLDGLLADIKVLAGSGASPMSTDDERRINTLLLDVTRDFALCESEVHQIYWCCKRVMKGNLSIKDTEIMYTPSKFDGYGTMKLRLAIKEDNGLSPMCIEITRSRLLDSHSVSKIEITKDSAWDSRGLTQHFVIGADHIAYYATCVDTSRVSSGGMTHQKSINRVWRM